MAKYERQNDLPPRSHPEYMKMYRAKHKERLVAQQKQWLSERPDYYKDIYDAEKARKYRENNREVLAEKNWRRRGIVDMTYERYQQDLHAQGGKCKICNKHMEVPHVDHDHNTGLYRALLCVACNNGLGIYEKNKELFEKYLENFSRIAQ